MADAHITTVEQAQALPEIENRMYEQRLETRPDGTIVRIDVVRPLSGHGISGDDIVLFQDKDGRSMEVVYTEGGPAKCEFVLTF